MAHTRGRSQPNQQVCPLEIYLGPQLQLASCARLNSSVNSSLALKYLRGHRTVEQTDGGG